MPLDLPAGTRCFIDSNIFAYHLIELGGPSRMCREFLSRVLSSELDAFTTATCLTDAIHRVMMVEAQERFGVASGVVAWLQRHPPRIRDLQAPLEAARQLHMLPLRLLQHDTAMLQEAVKLSLAHGLLTNDAMLLAAMRRHDLIHLVTNDDDFDAIPDLKLWKPR